MLLHRSRSPGPTGRQPLADAEMLDRGDTLPAAGAGPSVQLPRKCVSSFLRTRPSSHAIIIVTFASDQAAGLKKRQQAHISLSGGRTSRANLYLRMTSRKQGYHPACSCPEPLSVPANPKLPAATPTGPAQKARMRELCPFPHPAVQTRLPDSTAWAASVVSPFATRTQPVYAPVAT